MSKNYLIYKKQPNVKSKLANHKFWFPTKLKIRIKNRKARAYERSAFRLYYAFVFLITYFREP